MPGRRFHTVDAFARERYAGNQLAVFHAAGDGDAAEREGGLDADAMLALTRETNYSEAAFLEDDAPADGRYPVRIFDPAEELPFAGHPTLGTAAVIREFVRDDDPDELVLALGVGDVPVWVEVDEDGGERYWMDQVAPAFRDSVARDAIADVLGLDVADVRDAPIQVVSTGLPTLVVPLRDRDAVERAATQPDAYERVVVDALGGANVLVVAPGGVAPDADLHARVFADWAGVPEDPATGSAAGCLGAYLVRHDAVARDLGLDIPEGGRVPTDSARDDALDAVVEQGVEMDRPSYLHVRASVRDGDASDADDPDSAGADDADRGPADADSSVDVRVGGRVIPVSEGRLL